MKEQSSPGVFGRPDLSSLYEIHSGICGMAMFVKLEPNGAQKQPVVTNGKRLCFGPSFNTFPLQEKGFLLAHAMLHHALKHPQRKMAMMKREDMFFQKVWTIVCDAIVNDSLSNIPSFHLPAGEVSMEKLLEIVPDARRLSAEGLYKKIVDTIDIEKLEMTFGNVRDDIEDADIIMTGHGDGSGTPDEWKERLKQAFGNNPLGLNRLLSDMPQTKTPWQKILKSYIATCLGEQVEIDYSRPHRQWLAIEPGMRAQGINYPMSPGTRFKPQPKIAVALDTSGSISKTLLMQFLAEIAGVMRQTGAAVRLIVADAGVHQIEDFKNAKELLSFIPQGGGGTDFQPAIDIAEEYNPSVLIYFTDLEAAVPEKPKFPVMWAVPADTELQAPFGKLLQID